MKIWRAVEIARGANLYKACIFAQLTLSCRQTEVSIKCEKSDFVLQETFNRSHGVHTPCGEKLEDKFASVQCISVLFSLHIITLTLLSHLHDWCMFSRANMTIVFFFPALSVFIIDGSFWCHLNQQSLAQKCIFSLWIIYDDSRSFFLFFLFKRWQWNQTDY